MTSINELELQILRLMRDATAAELITWEQSETDSDWYYTKSGPIQSYIHFKWPAYNGAVGSDRDLVEVGGAGRFAIGTPGWSLALEILAADLEDWESHVAVLREQSERQVRLLNDALKQAGG